MEGETLQFNSSTVWDILPGDTFSSPLNVLNDITISKIRVILDISHPHAFGMTLTLLPPQGLPVVLASSPTGTAGGFQYSVFADTAPATVASSTPPYAGNYKPTSPLSSLNTRSTLGTWALQISDFGASAVGKLNGWSLIFNETTTEGEGEGEGEGEAVSSDVVTVTPATVSLVVGQTQQMAVTSTNSLDAVTWTSSAPLVASVNLSGKVTAISAGTTTITATGTVSHKTDTALVTVTAASTEGESITVNPLTRSFPSIDLPIYITSHSTVSTIINVPIDFTVSAMNLTLQLYHGNTHDLTAELESPSGTTVVLFTGPGGPGEGFHNTILSDSGSKSIQDGTPPFTGVYKPQNPLSAVYGESPKGIWRLSVTDNTTYNAGGITGWQIAFNDAATVTTDSTALERLHRWLWPVLGIFVPLGVMQLVGADPCFIATAAYGTPMANEINILRVFRDTFLMSNGPGTAFVDLYYQLSPPFADIIAVHPVLALLVRILLTPVVLFAYCMLACPGLPVLLLLAGGCWFWRRRLRLG